MDIKTKTDFCNLINRLRDEASGRSVQNNVVATNLEIIGVRTPVLRKLAKEIGINSPYLERHRTMFFETQLLWGFVIGKIKDREQGVRKLNEYIASIDSWALVDQTLPSMGFIIGTEQDFELFCKMLQSQKEFVVRYGVVGLMKYFIKERDIDRTLRALYGVDCGKYYIDMGIAWLLSEVIIKNPQNGKKIMQKIIKNNHFNKFIINKAIQKACESYRVKENIKQELKEIKI